MGTLAAPALRSLAHADEAPAMASAAAAAASVLAEVRSVMTANPS
jgi:hypothetical protein